MDLDHVLQLPAREVASALDALNISPGWLVGDAARAAAGLAPDEPSLPAPADRRNQAFQNLVVGTLTERTFQRLHLEPLEAHGFTIVPYHAKGENRDFGVQRDGLELPINVKVASTLFRKAQEVVGLDPEDCIPISAYKAIGSTEKVANLVYADLVDFRLREFVDGIMDGLDGPLGIGWHLLSWYKGTGAVRAQNEYLVALFAVFGDQLEALVGAGAAFRVVSAQRVLAIMRDKPRRVPGLGVKGAGTGIWKGEVDVHISIAQETRAWTDVADDLIEHGIQHVLDEIGRTRNAEVRDPRL